MRKIVFTIIVYFISELAGAASGLLLSRGLIDGKCYSERAIKRCSGSPVECTLELFPQTNGKLILKADSKNEIGTKKEFTQYGLINFKLVSSTNYQTEILKIHRIGLKRWLQKPIESEFANQVPCP